MLNRAFLVQLALLACCIFADVVPFSPSNEADYNAWNHGAFGNLPNQTFRSTKLRAPVFMVHKHDREAQAPGSHIVLSSAIGGQRTSPVILKASDLSLVYADPEWNGGGVTANVQEFNGSQYLTFWTGKGWIGWGAGGGTMVDDHYRMWKNISTTTPDLPGGADSHEFQLTHDGGALINSYYKRGYDISTAGGPKDGLIHDSAFQEIDLETGEARFTWKASDHFDLRESMNGYIFDADGGGWDWFHQNSLQKTVDGNYLISARHLCVLALINGTDGTVIWRLGGKHSNFLDLSDGGRATRFCFQHNARFVDDTMSELTVFDNKAEFASPSTPNCQNDCSRAIRLALDYGAMTVRLVQEWHHPKSVQAWAQGGVQALPGGGAMIGWGTVPSFTEVTADGQTVLEVQLSPWDSATGGRSGASLYRVHKVDFKAYPPWEPSIAAEKGTIYVSWNGATEVEFWEVYGGLDSSALEPQGIIVPRAGFETSIPVNDSVVAVQVYALDSDGNMIGSTDVVDAQTGVSLTPNIHLGRG